MHDKMHACIYLTVNVHARTQSLDSNIQNTTSMCTASTKTFILKGLHAGLYIWCIGKVEL